MKIGDLIKLHNSKRRCGDDAGKLGVILDLDTYLNLVIHVGGGTIKSFHITQIEEVVNESR